MKLYPLATRAVLAIRNNAAVFLNGLTTNTADKPRNAFVNIHGRIVATCDQYRISDDEFIIVVERAFVDSLLAHLDKYIRLSGVRIEKLERHVYFDVEGVGELPAGSLAIAQRKGRMVICEDKLPAGVSDEECTLFRVKNGIPVQGIDFKDEFLLNVGGDEFVSYTKGCFLGQEPLSKVHNRSKPTWKLVVRYQDQCSPEERQKLTSLTVEPATRRPMGFVFVRNETSS